MQTDHSSEIHRHETLKAFIAEKMAKKGGIPFYEYMHDALYTPDLGYYMAHPHIFGSTEEQDFITAPEVSALFGQSLANVCQKILKHIPNGVILELGAGSGKLAEDLLNALDKLGTTPKAYWILDPSTGLRAKQQDRLKNQTIPIEWLDKLPETPFVGIIIANEVLDAMPAQRFQVTGKETFELFVTHDGDNFQEEYRSTNDSEITQLAEYIREQTPEALLEIRPYQSERLPQLKSFFNSLSASLDTGVALFIDYGFPRHEFYHPDRYMGTLMCHQRQKTHPDPYHQVGLQDITTHVDFTDVAERAIDAGFSVAGYTQQAAFLMNAGLLSLYSEYATSLQLKTAMDLLTSPSEMGELFKVMALTKNIDIFPFPGFESFDKRRHL
jgi:SAM-dependent MidA family methyltransferase